MTLSKKQVNILEHLVLASGWMTRKDMESSAGFKGYSKALGAPTHGVRENTLEGLGLVERYDDSVPFRYRITAAGAQETLPRS